LEQASGRSIEQVADPWIRQRGAPLLEVRGDCIGRTLTLHFRQRQDGSSSGSRPSGPIWPIPIAVRFPGRIERTLIVGRLAALTLEGTEACPEWVYTNASQAGFYRVSYDERLLRPLIAAAERHLEVVERVGLLNDLWSSVRAGRLAVTRFLEGVRQVRHDHASAVVEEIAARAAFIRQYLIGPKDASTYSRFIEGLFVPLERELGWDGKEGDTDEARTLRATVLATLGETSRTPEVMNEVRRRAAAYLSDPGSIDPTVGTVLLRLAARTGAPALYSAFLDKLKTSASPNVEQRLLLDLPRFETPQLLERTLALSLSSAVRSQYVMKLVSAALYENQTRGATWSFVKRHFDELNQRARSSGFGWLLSATTAFCDDHSKRDVLRFFEDERHRPLRDEQLKEITETIEACSALRERQQRPLAVWLRRRLSRL
jgi:aminopeptidase N